MEGEFDGAGIRYGCKCGHLAPVGSLFFSEMCHKPVCRLPRCSVEEFESYYCGFLLVNMPSKEASMYQNRSSRCFSCVDCGSVLSTAFHDALQRYFFVCSHCRWDSIGLGLLEEDPDTLVMSAVARERESAQEDIFHTLLSHYSTVTATRSSCSNSSFPTAARAMRTSSGSFARGRTTSLQSLADSMKELQRDQQMKKYRLQRMAEMGGWKYDQAIEKVEQKEQWLLDQGKEHQWPELKAQLERFAPPPEVLDPATANDELVAKIAHQSKMGEVSTLQQRLINPLEQARDVSRVFPSRPLLRVKRTWRCVESIERGSAGILVKPQISPMSGDSSLPVPASWFKKANLAVHYMPIVTFQKLPYRTDVAGGVECILLIENPLDDAIQLVLHPLSVDSEEDRPEQTKVLVDDFTAITVGPYEDPNIADAFVSDASAAHMDQEGRNAMVVHSTRNLVQIKLPIQALANARSITFGFQLEMVKFDEESQQVVENSTLSFPVELVARVEP
uniref:Dynactin subunit 4 n=1 Tax=Globisporangium ultimum (strain ATCC 200006 / CBS 805.95 / DAOM BR144) TaxID=431595 RepID=K3WJQ3_GLOUD